MRKQWKQWQTFFSWAPKSLQMVTATMKLKDTCSLEESYDQPRQHIKKQRHYFVDKGLYNKSYGFSVVIYGCENWIIKNWTKNWCFWTVVLEKTLESPLDCKEIQPVHSEGGRPWDFCGRNNAKPEAPVLWPPHEKSWLTEKDFDAGRDWGQEEKGTTEDEMTGWHHGLGGRWVWVNSGRRWWTGRPGVLRFMGSQRVGHDWVTELSWTEN